MYHRDYTDETNIVLFNIFNFFKLTFTFLHYNLHIYYIYLKFLGTQNIKKLCIKS